MEDLIHRTSQTLQLLIEYDPVRQRLDRLRLGTSNIRLGVPASSRLRLSSPTDGVIERTANDDGTLRRRSLRLVIQNELVFNKKIIIVQHRYLYYDEYKFHFQQKYKYINYISGFNILILRIHYSPLLQIYIYMNCFINTNSLVKTTKVSLLCWFNSMVCFPSRRSNSICKSPGPGSPKEHPILARDISRSESLRASSSCSHRIFRPCDLIHGEVLGKGFFGQAIKVSPLFSFWKCFQSRSTLLCCQSASVGVDA